MPGLLAGGSYTKEREMRRYGSIGALMLMIALLSACAHAPKAHKLTIIGTADLQGLLEPVAGKKDHDGEGVLESVKMGGIARLGTRIHEIVRGEPEPRRRDLCR